MNIVVAIALAAIPVMVIGWACHQPRGKFMRAKELKVHPAIIPTVQPSLDEDHLRREIEGERFKQYLRSRL